MIGAVVFGHWSNVQAATAAGVRYDVAEYGSLDDYGASAIVRNINSAKEVTGGFKRGNGRRHSLAFVLSPNGFEDIPNDPGVDFSTTYGINDHNEVVGAINTLTSLRPFQSTRHTSFKQLGLLAGDTGGAAFAINENGESAGYSSGKASEHAVWWSLNGTIHPLPGLPNNPSRALDINDGGDIVGNSGAGLKHAVLWQDKGNVISLGSLPGYAGSEAMAINNTGEIAGNAIGTPSSRNFSRAVLWGPGGQTIQDLGALPGGDESRASDVSARGEVVGTSTSTHGGRAFIWTAATGMVDLNSLVALPGSVLTDAMGINSHGDIVALGHEGNPATDDDHGDVHDHERPRKIYVLTARP